MRNVFGVEAQTRSRDGSELSMLHHLVHSHGKATRVRDGRRAKTFAMTAGLRKALDSGKLYEVHARAHMKQSPRHIHTPKTMKKGA
jgi:hypothetical protein